MSKDIRSEKLDLGEVITQGWYLFIKNFYSFIPIILIIYIPANLCIYFMSAGLVEMAPNNENMDGIASLLLQFYGLIFIVMVLATLSLMALRQVIECSILEKPISWSQALGHAFSRLGASVWTMLLGGLIIMGMTFLLFIPGLIWSLYYIFIAFVVGLRGYSGKQALNYSKSLVKGQWWRVFGYILVIGFLQGFLAAAVATPLSFLPENILTFMVSNLLGNIAGVMGTCMLIVFFLNTDYLKQAETPSEAQENPQVLDA